MIYPLDEWEILREQIEYEGELGRGAFGVVYKAIFRERIGIEVFNTEVSKRTLLSTKKEPKVVAVKVLHGKISNGNRTEWSLIRSSQTSDKTKSDDRVARVWFVSSRWLQIELDDMKLLPTNHNYNKICDLLLRFSQTCELLSSKATFTIAFFAALNHNYDHKQRTLKHRNTRNGSKSTNHKSWPFEPVKVKFCFLRGPLKWLTVAKNAIVSWLLNFTILIRMLVKSAVSLFKIKTQGILTVFC